VFAIWVVRSNVASVFSLLGQSPEGGIAMSGEIIASSFVAIVCGLAAIAAFDVPYQLWNHASRLKMTKEELRQEHKEQEGDPKIRARIRTLQREAARRRMMSEVPKADVVVTNPTHYAVALSYRGGEMRAPRVLAKGAGHIAQKIRELALASAVPLLEAPPLARALYQHTEIGDEIPEKLYNSTPVAPSDLQVPPELDPLNKVRGEEGGHE
jgi:flagellar biosynthesis protein FlhB